ncbi:MAG: TRAP transporter small permease subunit [Gammaproteobacteria bacterium]|nr:TRAP transporter small permease subunit [Gammaproteobacteria bacterium]
MLRRLRDALIWIAGGALLVAVAVDSLAMIGRQIRFPLIGSIEIVEVVVLFAAGGGLIVATLDGAHARVNLLLERLPDIWRERVMKLHALAAALLFAALLAGTVWIAADLWDGHEESELLRIPYRPLRIAAALTLAVLVLLSLLRLTRRRAD